jgi:hypothetical protein
MATPNWLQSRAAQPVVVAAPQAPIIQTKVTALEALTQSLVATSTGFALGVAHSELRGGLDVHGKPADLVGSVVFGLAGYFGNSRTCLTISHVCEGVYGFRKGIDLLKVLEMVPRKGKQETEKEPAVDDVEVDPVVAASKDIDDVQEQPVITVHGEDAAAE